MRTTTKHGRTTRACGGSRRSAVALAGLLCVALALRASPRLEAAQAEGGGESEAPRLEVKLAKGKSACLVVERKTVSESEAPQRSFSSTDWSRIEYRIELVEKTEGGDLTLQVKYGSAQIRMEGGASPWEFDSSRPECGGEAGAHIREALGKTITVEVSKGRITRVSGFPEVPRTGPGPGPGPSPAPQVGVDPGKQGGPGPASSGSPGSGPGQPPGPQDASQWNRFRGVMTIAVGPLTRDLVYILAAPAQGQPISQGKAYAVTLPERQREEGAARKGVEKGDRHERDEKGAREDRGSREDRGWRGEKGGDRKGKRGGDRGEDPWRRRSMELFGLLGLTFTFEGEERAGDRSLALVSLTRSWPEGQEGPAGVEYKLDGKASISLEDGLLEKLEMTSQFSMEHTGPGGASFKSARKTVTKISRCEAQAESAEDSAEKE